MTMRWLGVAVFAVVVGLVGTACSSSSATACTAGATQACTGTGGCKGTETCDTTGSAYGACECPMKDAGVDAGATAAFAAKCSGTYACTGTESANVTPMKANGKCTVMLMGLDVILEPNGQIENASSGDVTGTWSVASSGAITVDGDLGLTEMCTPAS